MLLLKQTKSPPVYTLPPRCRPKRHISRDLHVPLVVVSLDYAASHQGHGLHKDHNLLCRRLSSPPRDRSHPDHNNTPPSDLDPGVSRSRGTSITRCPSGSRKEHHNFPTNSLAKTETPSRCSSSSPSGRQDIVEEPRLPSETKTPSKAVTRSKRNGRRNEEDVDDTIQKVVFSALSLWASKTDVPQSPLPDCVTGIGIPAPTTTTTPPHPRNPAAATTHRGTTVHHSPRSPTGSRRRARSAGAAGGARCIVDKDGADRSISPHRRRRLPRAICCRLHNADRCTTDGERVCGVDGNGILNEQPSDAASCPSFLSLCGTETDATSGRTCYTGDVAEPLFEDSGWRGRISGKGEGKNPLLPRFNFQLYVKGPSEAKTQRDHAEAYFADERRILPGSVGVSLLVGDMDSLETTQSPAATTSTRFSRCVFGDQ